ncbi:Corticotropin-releasing factor-binding protein [Nymphon striatum]|nr:Corticotropin-releasing factor-binding protein [Nymphon striatum]
MTNFDCERAADKDDWTLPEICPIYNPEDGTAEMLVDGWELNGQTFPSPSDGLTPVEERMISFCGRLKPRGSFTTSQNVGLIRFMIATEHEGFDVTVRFIKNPTPCNVLLTQSTGAFTIGNHGKNVNCSVSIMAPVKFQMMSASKDLSICRRPQKPSPLLEFLKRSSQFNEFLIRTYGYMNEIPKEEDCVEYRGGNNLNPMEMDVVPFTGYYFFELLFSSVLLFYKKALVSGFY